MNTRFAVNGKGISLLTGALILMAGSQVHAANRLVPQQYHTIQAGINAAKNGDTVIVADGTYTGAGNRDLRFSGKAIAVLSASDDPAKCIIDCELSGNGFDFQSGETTTSVVRGITIRSGIVGIMCEGTSPTIINCIVTLNQANGMYCAMGSPLVTDCTFIKNIGGIAGGAGMLLNQSQAKITHCTFTENVAVNDGGGGIRTEYYSTPTITNCVFTKNSAISGAAIINVDTSPTIINCSFSGNTASGAGGAICSFSRSTVITNCTFTGNRASQGGAIYSGGSLNLTNCAFSGNWSGDSGSALFNNYSTSTITNCTFTSNFRSNTDFSAALVNLNSRVVITNSIISGLYGNLSRPMVDTASTSVVTYSTVQHGWSGSGNISTDPRFVRNPSAGPDRVWGTGDDDFGDLRLDSRSTSLDAGNGLALSTGTTTDLAGLPRISRGKVDLGAFEYQNQAPVAENYNTKARLDGYVNFQVCINSRDPEGDPLALVSFTQPTRGTVYRNGNVLTYLSERSLTGKPGLYSFTYTIQDSYGAQATGTITVNVIK